MKKMCMKSDEKAIFALRSLYRKYGYMQYKMSKFEEYDLYIRNKSFLVSDNIITFTDTDGKLMALKPDVTLSIVKNIKPAESGVRKLYYNENVYRVSKSTQSFKEIMQTGLECIGDIDDYTIYETIMLAAESLNTFSSDYVIDISHMGIVASLVGRLDVPDDISEKIMKCIGDKNLSELEAIEKNESIDLGFLKKMITTYGTLENVTEFLESLDCPEEAQSVIRIMKSLEKNGYKNKVRIDFSIVSDMNYYNGFIFKGFINKIPASVLSGGQYDNLMTKMNRKEKAIGFALYLDMLKLLSEEHIDYDVDTIILYDDKTDIDSVNEAVKLLSSNGSTVIAQKCVPDTLRYKQLVRLTRKGVEILENNA